MLSHTTDPSRGWQILLSPAWVSTALLTGAFAAICWGLLAPWQFERHNQREIRNELIAALPSASPVPVLDRLNLQDQPSEELAWQPVTATGAFHAEAQTLVGLRQFNDSPAFEVVLPFVLVTGQVLLVDRGYVTAKAVTEGNPVPTVPSGVLTITGRIQAEQPDPAGRPPVEHPGWTEVRGISVQTLLDADQPALRGFVQLTPQSPGVLESIGLPQIDGGPYKAYAFQWITFGAVAVFGVGRFAYRDLKDATHQTERAAAAGYGRFDKRDLYD